jgi:ribonucleoside-triphosphate reductase
MSSDTTTVSPEISAYQQMIFTSRYARWREDLGRRETYQEAVDRYIDFMFDEQTKGKLGPGIKEECRQAILRMDVMPSMRALMTAGPALARDNVAGFNCAYVAVDNPATFGEILYILTCGTGVGFSEERQVVKRLPRISESVEKSSSTITVEDSRIGWANALNELVAMLYTGRIPDIDYTKIRPAGARLKTFGGRASGPKPLKALFDFVIHIFRDNAGERLNSVQVHDIVCKIAETIVVGGVRRSALIALSNLSDTRMRDAKSGEFWRTHPQRACANNSVAYTETPDFMAFAEEFLALIKSNNGERGIFNRCAAYAQAKKTGRRSVTYLRGDTLEDAEFGLNPCGEIILRSGQFCNLTSVVIRPEDDEKSITDKIRIATILGTVQSTLTNFKFIRSLWRKNTEEEALLGVSLNGIMDNEFFSGQGQDISSNGALAGALERMRASAIAVNAEIAPILGVNPSASITCIKPEGTTSQLVDCSSGIHARHSRYYIRSIRGDNKDPLTKYMKSIGVPNEPEVSKPDDITVFYFPIESPAHAVLRKDMTAMRQLDLWRLYRNHWCEHNPSVTVNVKDHEWFEVQAWVWKHFDEIGGISFLPYSDPNYPQLPYNEVDLATYEELVEQSPVSIDFTGLIEFEIEDGTKGAAAEMACTSGGCELTNISQA